MKTIKINGIDYEFKYSFKNLKELCQSEKMKLDDIHEFGQDFTNAPKIIFYGIGKALSIEEIETHLDESGWESVIESVKLFGLEVSRYFVGEKIPNESATSSESVTED